MKAIWGIFFRDQKLIQEPSLIKYQLSPTQRWRQRWVFLSKRNTTSLKAAKIYLLKCIPDIFKLKWIFFTCHSLIVMKQNNKKKNVTCIGSLKLAVGLLGNRDSLHSLERQKYMSKNWKNEQLYLTLLESGYSRKIRCSSINCKNKLYL